MADREEEERGHSVWRGQGHGEVVREPNTRMVIFV
jgi:hypothetical protein